MGASSSYTVQNLTQVIAIAAGGFHTVVARRDGTVWTWGRSDAGQLGTGRVQGRGSYSSVPVQVPAMTHVSAVAAGGEHTLALRRDGTVWAWGANDYGQLGRGPHTLGAESTARPMRVLGLTDVRAIAAGRAHNVVVRRDRTVWAWGINGYGELGVEGNDSAVPVQVPGLPAVAAVAAGENHSLALAFDGTVWTWGLNVEEDAAEEATASPRPVAGVTDVVAVAAGKFHSLALRRDGTVWAWGSNYFGQLGNGHTESRATPLPVDNLEDVMDIAAASLHNLAVRRDGTVWAWGADELRDLVGDDDLVPAQVPALHDVAMVATGDNHAIALTGAGTVKTWGWNNFGQLGNGEEGTHYYLPQDD
ncbi:MAG TPA: hypothetical protein VKF37_14745 [Chloroflexota bacterium]|nr:hypothetical protein [Chloroflexota bacterium]